MLRLLQSLSLMLPVGILLILTGPVLAGMPGDAAPELQIKEWVQGGPFTLQEGKERPIYVIEFWQTDCPHCLESLPYLSFLQDKYKNDGVTVIGITSEDAETVRAFLKGNQDAGYALAVDDEDKTYDRYMKMFNVSGVPHAFIVGPQRRILWEGHPQDDLDVVLEQIVTGSYDLKKVQDAFRAKKLLAIYAYLCTQTDETDIARIIGERILAHGRDSADVNHRLARFIVLNKDNRNPDGQLGVQAAEHAYRLTKGGDPAVLEIYAGALKQIGRPERAQVYLQKAEALRCAQAKGDADACQAVVPAVKRKGATE